MLKIFLKILLVAMLGASAPTRAGAGGQAGMAAGVRDRPRSSVVLVRARVDGRPEVSSALQSGFGRFTVRLRDCQEHVRKLRIGSVGRLAIEVTIGTKGRIVDVSPTRSTTVAHSLSACSMRALKGARLADWSQPHPVVASVVFDFLLLGAVRRGAVAAGGLTKPLVAGVIEEYLPELGPCVPAGRTVRIILSGVIRFDGRVKRVKVTGRRLPRSLRTCMASKVKKWLFPFGKGGHRTWFQYATLVQAGRYEPPRPRAQTAGLVRPQAVSASRAAVRGGASAVRPAAPQAGRTQARPSPKVGLVEVKVGASFIPPDVDSKILNRRLGRILKRMKKCGGLTPGVFYKLFMDVDRKGAVKLIPVTGLAVPRQAMRCLSSAVAHVTFPVSATRAHGYRITVSVRGLEGASVKRARPARRRRRRRRK